MSELGEISGEYGEQLPQVGASYRGSATEQYTDAETGVVLTITRSANAKPVWNYTFTRVIDADDIKEAITRLERWSGLFDDEVNL